MKEKTEETGTKEPTIFPEGVDMLKLLQDVALGKVEATPLQVRAAIAAVQYTHTRTKDGGKKEAKRQAAEGAVSGKFAQNAPPKLSVVKNA